MINIRLSRDFKSNIRSYYEYLYSLINDQLPLENNDSDFNAWTHESLQLVCEQVYIDEANKVMNKSVSFKLGNSYYDRNIRIVEQRLVQGGQRLAALFNRLAKRNVRISSKCPKLHSNIFQLIALIFIILQFHP